MASGFRAAFGRRLDELIRGSGMTRTDFAARMYASPYTVNDWCRGRYAPNAKQLPKIAKILGCGYEELLGDAGNG